MDMKHMEESSNKKVLFQAVQILVNSFNKVLNRVIVELELFVVFGF